MQIQILLLAIIGYYWVPIIAKMTINVSIIAIKFFIIAIILLGSKYLLLFEGMAARSMRVGLSICSPQAPALGLDCQVSGLTSCVPSPNWMSKSSSEGTQMASAHAIIERAG